MKTFDVYYLSQASGNTHKDYVDSYIKLLLEDNQRSYGVIYLDDLHLPIIHQVNAKTPEVPQETASMIIFEWMSLGDNSDDAFAFFKDVCQQGIVVSDYYIYDGNLLVSALDTPLSNDVGVLS
jgi:hypothetical protein